MTDLVFMVKNTSYMFITGPDVIKSVLGEVVTQEELGGAMTHSGKSGVPHFACDSDAHCIDQIKRLLSFLFFPWLLLLILLFLLICLVIGLLIGLRRRHKKKKTIPTV